MEIMPSFRCNLNCPFCINDTFDPKPIMNLEWLKNVLDKVEVNQLHILGGEPSLLPGGYLRELIDICKNRLGGKRPGVYTNLIKIFPYAEDVELLVSFHPDAKHADKVLNNMLALPSPFSVTIIATKFVVENWGVKKLLRFKKRIPSLKRLSIVKLKTFPGAEYLRPSPQSMMKFIEDLLKYDTEHELRFYPLDNFLSGEIKNLDASDVIELLPTNNFRVALRDFNDVQEFDTYAEAEAYYNANRNVMDKGCDIDCPYFRRCLHMYNENGCGVNSADYMIAQHTEALIHEYLS